MINKITGPIEHNVRGSASLLLDVFNDWSLSNTSKIPVVTKREVYVLDENESKSSSKDNVGLLIDSKAYYRTEELDHVDKVDYEFFLPFQYSKESKINIMFNCTCINVHNIESSDIDAFIYRAFREIINTSHIKKSNGDEIVLPELSKIIFISWEEERISPICFLNSKYAKW